MSELIKTIESANMSPIIQALVAGLFTWFVTALGAALIFIKKEIGRKILDSSLGFSAGIMVAASFFSLLLPSIELSDQLGLPKWLPATFGFIAGGLFLKVIDSIVPHLHLFMPMKKVEGLKTKLSKTTLLILAITIHNFPEGISVGVTFGSIETMKAATFIGAITLTIGIAIQNFPEGMAVSFPLLKEGNTKFKSFLLGALSAIVEPLGAVLGAASVVVFKNMLPFALSFAAGAMIYVVVEELIPESQSGGNEDLATIGTILGFVVMMFLDVAFS